MTACRKKFADACDQQAVFSFYQGRSGKGGGTVEDREIIELFWNRDDGAIAAAREKGRGSGTWRRGCWAAVRTGRSASTTPG
jgi:hypothetical protein